MPHAASTVSDVISTVPCAYDRRGRPWRAFPNSTPPAAAARSVRCADSIAWLRTVSLPARCHVITSLPDRTELKLSSEAYEAWFASTVELILSKLPRHSIAIFYQTSGRHSAEGGGWLDKSLLCHLGARAAGAACVWHSIVSAGGVGALRTGGRVGYAHMLCFSAAHMLRPGTSCIDVLESRGHMSYAGAMGEDAAAAAVQYVARAHQQASSELAPSEASGSGLVLDPFCGEGTVLAMANAYGLDAWGLDTNRKRCAVASRRRPRVVETAAVEAAAAAMQAAVREARRVDGPEGGADGATDAPIGAPPPPAFWGGDAKRDAKSAHESEPAQPPEPPPEPPPKPSPGPPPDPHTLLSSLADSPPPWQDPAHSSLEQYGLAVVRGACSQQLASEVRALALDALDVALALPMEQSAALLGEIRSPLHRHDIKLELSSSVPLRQLLGALLHEGGLIGRSIAEALGDDAALCELSCICAEAGARAQPAHCDTAACATAASGVDGNLARMLTPGTDANPNPQPARLITLFVALQDVLPESGPTTMWPATHTARFHSELAAQGPLLLQSRPAVRMDLRAGDTALMDSRLWHCGGPNLTAPGSSSAARRCLLVASFARPGEFPGGSTYSMLPSEAGRHSLSSLRRGWEGRAAAEEEEQNAEEGRMGAPGEVVAMATAADSRALVEAPRASLPMAAARQLLSLAVTLPDDEPRARQCRETLLAAKAEAESAGALDVQVPIGVLRVLCQFRVLGPHLRATSRWAALQRWVDAVLDVSVS